MQRRHAWGWLDTVPGFPDRLRENPPRQGFFEHPEYLAVRAHLPAPWQDILDLADYSGWRKNEILAADWRLVAALARRDPNSLLVFHRNGIAIRRWRTACRPASSTIAAAPPPATRRPQTSGATPRGLNPGFSESIGNSRRTGIGVDEDHA